MIRIIPATAKTITGTVYIAGDLADIKRSCKAFCGESTLCVSVKPTDFIYAGGEQSGAQITLINYPKTPSSLPEIKRLSLLLAEKLLADCFQRSCTVVFSDESVYLERPNVPED